MLGVMIKIWNNDQKDQIYLSVFPDILAGVAGEYCAFIEKRFDAIARAQAPLSGCLRVHPTYIEGECFISVGQYLIYYPVF